MNILGSGVALTTRPISSALPWLRWKSFWRESCRGVPPWAPQRRFIAASNKHGAPTEGRPYNVSFMNTERIRNDFDELARLSDVHGGGEDRYDSFLLSVIPNDATSLLEVGCGLGRLTARLALANRQITAVDLSPEMIARARRENHSTRQVTFLCADFLEQDFGSQQFDCVVSAATLHHMPENIAITRMTKLLRPGGRLVIQDIRSDVGLRDKTRTNVALAQLAVLRLLKTGRLRSPRLTREAWQRHSADEKYLSLTEADALARRLLPGASVVYHWLWRYTIVWDKPRVL
jgi:2-polyprenyl-3-methyl-5-hydroxy-6-metoxy-1,4-benzoquinol methylase